MYRMPTPKHIYGIHLADKAVEDSIVERGLLASSSLNLWMGLGVYHAYLRSWEDLDGCISYCRKFVEEKPNFSGEVSVVLSKISTSGMVLLQDKDVLPSIQHFGRVFDDKCEATGFRLPVNDDRNRPASYLRYECWKLLVERAIAQKTLPQSESKVAVTLCRFQTDTESDAPPESPQELCVRDPIASSIIHVGSPDEVRNVLREFEFNSEFPSIEDRRRSLMVAGAAFSAVRQLGDMERRDFLSLLETIKIEAVKNHQLRSAIKSNVVEFQPADEVVVQENYRLACSSRARYLNSRVALHDMDLIRKDFAGRKRNSNQLEFQLNYSGLNDIIHGSNPRSVAKQFIQGLALHLTPHPYMSLMGRLPLDIRRIKGLRGTAYYFPKGELSDKAVLVTRSGQSYSSGKPTKLAVDRAHELGHYVFQECALTRSNEEQWCDDFAEHFVELLRQMRSEVEYVTSELAAEANSNALDQ